MTVAKSQDVSSHKFEASLYGTKETQNVIPNRFQFPLLIQVATTCTLMCRERMNSQKDARAPSKAAPKMADKLTEQFMASRYNRNAHRPHHQERHPRWPATYNGTRWCPVISGRSPSRTTGSGPWDQRYPSPPRPSGQRPPSPTESKIIPDAGTNGIIRRPSHYHFLVLGMVPQKRK